MLNKIYLIALAVLAVPMMVLTYLSWSWLQSIGSPAIAVENYSFYSFISWSYLWISTAILLVLANVLLWKTRRAWAMWTTLAYFLTFIALRYFWLENSLHEFYRNNGVQIGLALSPLIGVVLCLLAGAIVFFNQFINLRLSEKMHPTAELPTGSVQENYVQNAAENDPVVIKEDKRIN